MNHRVAKSRASWIGNNRASAEPTRAVNQIPTPGRQPTNVAFGGPDFDTLIVTEVEAKSVYRIKLGVKGHRLFGGLHHR